MFSDLGFYRMFFAFYCMPCYLQIAALILPAPCLAFIRPSLVFIRELADFAGVRSRISLLNGL